MGFGMAFDFACRNGSLVGAISVILGRASVLCTAGITLATHATVGLGLICIHRHELLADADSEHDREL